MSGEAYTLDTNILVYALDHTAGERHDLAKQIISLASRGPCLLTLQSVGEFYAVATRKRVMTPAEASVLAGTFLDLFRTATASLAAVKAALAAAASGRGSYWDSLLMATAAEAGCTTILTEDLAADSVFMGVRIVNPFAGDRLSSAADAVLRAR